MIWINWIAYLLALMFVVLLIALAVSEIKEFAEKVRRAFNTLDELEYKVQSSGEAIGNLINDLQETEQDIFKLNTESGNNSMSINDITVTVSNLNKKINELEKQEDNNE